MPTPLQAECLAAAGNTADHLLNLAQQDQHGIYWDCSPRTLSTADNAAMELSISTGTPGILLFLAEFFRQTQDSRLSEVLARSISWIRARAKSAPLRNGFYNGYPGMIYAVAIAEKTIGASPAAGSSDNWRALLKTKRYDMPFLANGVAGSILALECLRDMGVSDAPIDLVPEFLRIVIRQTKLTSNGIYWSRHPASMRPCVSFLNGSAGIEYVLSRLASGSASCAVTWLAEAGMLQENAQFDAATKNWPDFINEDHFRRPGIEKVLHKAADRGERGPFSRPGDSIGWANGSSGVLLARQAWSASALRNIANADIARAANRLTSALPSNNKYGSNFSLYSGWAGVGLTAAHIARFGSDRHCVEINASVANACLEHHRTRAASKPAVDGSLSHLALLRGSTGVAYYLLQVSEPALDRSVLAPLGVQPSPRALPLSRSEAFREIASGALPRTTSAPEVALPSAPPEKLTLETFLQSAEAAIRNTCNGAEDILAYESAILRTEANQDCYNYLAWRRTKSAGRLRASPEFSNNRLLLKRTVVLQSEVQLGRLKDSRRHTPSNGEPTGGNSLVLLVPEFCGVVEHPVPAATYAVLSQLKRPLKVEVLCRVVQEKYPSLRATDGIETLVLREVRNGLLTGALRFQRSQFLSHVFKAFHR